MLLRWGCIAVVVFPVLGCSAEREPHAAGQADAAVGMADADSAVLDGATHAAQDVELPTDAALEDAGRTYAPLDAGTCTPGVPRCHGDFGFQQCEQSGTWGPPHSCAGYSNNGTSSYCVMTVGSANEPWAACVDPACWYWLKQGFVPGPTAVGICESSTTIRQCNGGGTLSTETCEGVCTQVGMLDGRALGYCSPQCSDGARECLGGPLYRECQAGRWLADPGVCAGSDECVPLGTGATPDIRCGGACDSGTSRCAADHASVEVCSEAGQWEPGQECRVGACLPAGPQAQCQAECTPGQFQCEEGGSTQRGCSEQHLWQAATPCEPGTSCRHSLNTALGCVACVGPDSAGGNAFGVSDSRCEAGGVVRCGENNTWLPPGPCAASETCTEQWSGSSSVAHCASL